MVKGLVVGAWGQLGFFDRSRQRTRNESTPIEKCSIHVAEISVQDIQQETRQSTHSRTSFRQDMRQETYKRHHHVGGD